MAHVYFSVPILILEPVKFWPLPEKKNDLLAVNVKGMNGVNMWMRLWLRHPVWRSSWGVCDFRIKKTVTLNDCDYTFFYDLNMVKAVLLNFLGAF